MILHGDCLAHMREMGDDSVDSIVTDPPYGLAFMGKKWDYDVPSVDVWKEVLRVLKPGGHLLSFGGTRTYHRMVVAIEDAGFEIRDQVQWIYGSGFPKSLDVSKAIDKAAGAEREVVGTQKITGNIAERDNFGSADRSEGKGMGFRPGDINLTAPSTDAAKQWQGWGTALKPANEPIVLARKPLCEKTVAANVLKWGTGGINVDGCRVSTSETLSSGRHTTGDQQGPSGYKTTNRTEYVQAPQGRFPSNLLLDETAAEMLDAQSGTLKSGTLKGTEYIEGKIQQNAYGSHNGHISLASEANAGGASRFFYVAKASKRERNEGLDGMPEKESSKMDGGEFEGNTTSKNRTSANHHPTVKPITLMRYLCRLITPPNGIVLDPFAGSGSTGVAALKEGFQFIGIEKETEYVEIAKKRLEYGSKA